MGFRLLDYILGVKWSLALILAVILFIRMASRVTKLDFIPTAGSSNLLGSYWDSLTYLKNGQSVVQKGYDKFKSAPFKIVESLHWRVVVSKREHLEELAKASDDEFSSWKAAESQFQMNHTFGPKSKHIPRYISFVGACMSKNIEAMCPEIEGGIATSFPKVLDLIDNEWKSVPALNTIEQVVCRTSNRAFVGFPLCHDPEWIKLSKQCTDDLIEGGYIIGLFPEFMRPLAVRYFTRIPRNIAHCAKLLDPVIEERRKYLHKCKTEWDDTPNDLLLWLMEDARDADELTAEHLIVPLMLTCIAALRTVSNCFTQALFCLAANPQHIQPLREEAEGVVGKHGWSKMALGKMRKVDSFLRECQRTQGISAVTLVRTALKDFTFSDGTFIPNGTSIAAACQSIHHDEQYYENPEVFDPFRFVDMHGGEGDSANHQLVTTTLEYLSFGHGRYACPGRFLAGCEMKFMLAYVVLMYDVKLEDGATIPPNVQYGLFSTANPHAKVMFRKRVD